MSAFSRARFPVRTRISATAFVFLAESVMGVLSPAEDAKNFGDLNIASTHRHPW